MTRIRNLFLLLAFIGPLHMAEQLVTSIEEFYKLRDGLAVYYDWFTWTDPDRATVILITIVFTAMTAFCYALLVGGIPQLVAMAIFGVLGAQEIHHVFEAILKRGYDPGVVTCIPYALVGNLLIHSVWQELKHTKRLTTRPATARMAQARRFS